MSADPTGGAGKALLIRNARCVAPFDDTRSVARDASVIIRGHRVEAVGLVDDLAQLDGRAARF